MSGASDGLVISRADQGDIPELDALVQSAYRGDASRAGWTTEADLIEGQRIDAGLLAELLGSHGTEVLTFRSADGDLVACCELARRGEDVAYLGMFAVRPGLQGAGVGRRVLDEAVRIAGQEWGCERLEIEVIHLREELLAWYARRGFELTGETRPFPYGEERYGLPTRDDLHMVVLSRALDGRNSG